jgi:curved DNA-binding protein CbpA
LHSNISLAHIALKTHPDRLPKGSTTADKKRATERFQAVADAYYVLSDPTRRRDYDDLARQRGGRSAGPGAGGFSSTGGGSSQQQSGAGGAGGFPDFDFSDFMNNMNNARKRQSSSRAQEAEEEEEEEYEEKRQNDESSGFFKTFAGMFGYGGKKNDGRPDANKMFGDVFEDM